MPVIDLAVVYIPEESHVRAFCIVQDEVVMMPGTTADLRLPLTGLVTIQVAGPKVTYTTHGVGGDSVTINIREVLDDAFREMFGAGIQLGILSAAAQNAFNSPALVIA